MTKANKTLDPLIPYVRELKKICEKYALKQPVISRHPELSELNDCLYEIRRNINAANRELNRLDESLLESEARQTVKIVLKKPKI